METVIQVLDKMYSHVEEMVKFSEAKNTTLIAFNGAIVIGLATLLKDLKELEHIDFFKGYIIAAISFCGLSIFVSLASLIAKMLHIPLKVSIKESDNLMFHGTIARLNNEELITKIKEKYLVHSINKNYEIDRARQIVIIAQIASRKFSLFNTAIAFTFCGILTPLSYICYLLFLDHD